jgi:hypothetical protein
MNAESGKENRGLLEANLSATICLELGNAMRFGDVHGLN